jgi:hypothetical protein
VPDEKGAFDSVETIFVKLGNGVNYDLKLEHYDDYLQDNSF